MKVVLIPEMKNEELIERVSELFDCYSGIDYDELYLDCVTSQLAEWEAEYGRDDMLDALYYASSHRKEMLEAQAKYFYDCLCHDEYSYYESRMLFGDASID